jgi:transposase
MSETRARVLLPNRRQMEFRASDLESLLPEGHRARLVWAYVERQDLKGFYAGIRAVEGGMGRSAIAPEILLSLWLYATLDGVGSAREIARLSEAHDAYRWLCGGVQVNYHTVSDFRKDHGEALDELLSVSIASLMAAGVVKLKQVAQDGMRVRASAGAGSFRRKEKLAGYLEAAGKVGGWAASRSGPGAEAGSGAAAGGERAGGPEKALARLPESKRSSSGKAKSRKRRGHRYRRRSQVMKMGDGGFRPAYNATAATPPLVIIGVDVATLAATGRWRRWWSRSRARGQAPRRGWSMRLPGHEQIDQASARPCWAGTGTEGPRSMRTRRAGDSERFRLARADGQ